MGFTFLTIGSGLVDDAMLQRRKLKVLGNLSYKVF